MHDRNDIPRWITFIGAMIFISLGTSPVFAQSEPYRPLNIGNWWEYHGTGGEHEVQRVARVDSIWGDKVCVVHYEQSTNNEGLENYWTSKADGGLLLWGWNRTLDGTGLLYEPPIVYIDAPLSLGKTWISTCNVYKLPDTTYIGTLNIEFCVYEEGYISVPAGDFYSFGIGITSDSLPFSVSYANDAGSKKSTGLDGRTFRGLHALAGEHPGTSQESGAGNWYCLGRGEVQYGSSEFLQLNARALADVKGSEVPKLFSLHQNYPNPFSSQTAISFELTDQAIVSLRLYDAAGRVIRVLAGGQRNAGHQNVAWDGRDARGRSLASGTYFYRLDAGTYTQTKKMILLR
jgi:hypothetical protein